MTITRIVRERLCLWLIALARRVSVQGDVYDHLTAAEREQKLWMLFD